MDFGSQYTQLIARRVREIGVRSIIVHAGDEKTILETEKPVAVVLSGGPDSVYAVDSPKLASGSFDFVLRHKTPVLGICYGMQLLVHELGGSVRAAPVREYGKMKIRPKASSLFQNTSEQTVWMSHGDEAEKLPTGFQIIAQSETGSIAAIEDSGRKIFGLQFHPEVSHTERGLELLKRFVFEVAHAKADWTAQNIIDHEVSKIKELAGSDSIIVSALSGGVDSTVASVLVKKAIGDRLHCMFVDHGLLRKNEAREVMDLYRSGLGLNVTKIDAADKFLGYLQGIEDPEVKRRIIGREFIRSFEDFSTNLEAKTGKKIKFLVQGTLYPDVIESKGGNTGSKKWAHKIKTHHNVGGLPKDLKFQLIEPLRDLFKDEVRSVGKSLGIPKEFLNRHPFPGPGLAVRIPGTITLEKLEILKNADDVFIQSLREFGIYDEIWQAFAVFVPVRTVGVQGDARTHDYVVALRAVTSTDGMTVDWYRFDHDLLAEISSRICNRVKGVSRVVYDISSKPPATIEWE